MSIKTYYRWALLLPLLVPALAWLLGLLSLLPPVLAVVMMYLFWSMLIGGVPYLLFAIGFVLWMRRAPDEHVRIGILLSPLVYTAVLLVALILFLLVDGAVPTRGDSLGTLALYGLGTGYLYVALAEVGRAFLRPGTASSAAPAL